MVFLIKFSKLCKLEKQTLAFTVRKTHQIIFCYELHWLCFTEPEKMHSNYAQIHSNYALFQTKNNEQIRNNPYQM